MGIHFKNSGKLLEIKSRQYKKAVIVFAPHPDDETLGCGGTIAKKIAQEYQVLIIIMTDGRNAFSRILDINYPTSEDLKEIRKEEIKRAMKILGVPPENLIFLNFVDGTLQEFWEEAEKKVIEILSENYPIEIYLPHKNDDHPDHRATYYIVKNSIKKLGISPVMYQYLITHRHTRFGPFLDRLLNYFMRNMVYVDISQFLKNKEAAVREFKSQITLFLEKQKKPIIPNIKRFLKTKEVFYIDK